MVEAFAGVLISPAGISAPCHLLHIQPSRLRGRRVDSKSVCDGAGSPLRSRSRFCVHRAAATSSHSANSLSVLAAVAAIRVLPDRIDAGRPSPLAPFPRLCACAVVNRRCPRGSAQRSRCSARFRVGSASPLPDGRARPGRLAGSRTLGQRRGVPRQRSDRSTSARVDRAGLRTRQGRHVGARWLSLQPPNMVRGTSRILPCRYVVSVSGSDAVHDHLWCPIDGPLGGSLEK